MNWQVMEFIYEYVTDELELGNMKNLTCQQFVKYCVLYGCNFVA